MNTTLLETLTLLEKEATPAPWVRWVDHATIVGGPVKTNTPGILSGNRGTICEMTEDNDYLVRDVEDDEDAETIMRQQAMNDGDFIVALRNAWPAIRECMTSATLTKKGK